MADPPYQPTVYDAAVGHVLPRGPAAWLVSEDRVFHASRPSGSAPWSPVLDLIQGVWETHPARAHAILRRRIITTFAPSRADRALVKVAAKKVAGPSERTPGPTPPTWIDVGPAAREVRAWVVAELAALPACVGAPMAAARGLAGLARQSGRPATSDRAVGAVLTDGEGRPLMVSTNRHARNRTLHAELCLVVAWHLTHQAPLPAGARLHVTLQPCAMCAALLVDVAEGPIEVIYDTPDPGRFARSTALDAAGWIRPHVEDRS